MKLAKEAPDLSIKDTNLLSETSSAETAQIKRQTEQLRLQNDPVALAEILEKLAGSLIREANLLEAAASLEQASEIWRQQSDMQRMGASLLLATSSRRLAMDLAGAGRNLEVITSVKLPAKISQGFWLEKCEQLIAANETKAAETELTDLLIKLQAGLEPCQLAHILQRRAAVYIANSEPQNAAADFLRASAILKNEKLPLDAEACSLAAASALIDSDPESAEEIIQKILSIVPRDGSAQTLRGLVAGRISMKLGKFEQALKRFDQARQGAVDVCDANGYLSAVVNACEAAEKNGDLQGAYARYARAWNGLSDLLGSDSGHKLIKPLLEDFRQRIGLEKFGEIKRAYELQRKVALSNVHS